MTLKTPGVVEMPLTVSECAQAYMASRWSRGEITRETLRSFRETLRLFSEWCGPRRRLSDLQRPDIEKWLGDMKCAAATKRLRLSTVKGMLQWAVIEGHARRDPTLGIRGPKKPRSVPRHLTDKQVQAVLACAKDKREYLILILMLEEGLRAGGVAGLQLGDIDLIGRTLRVTEKGGHERPVPITDRVAQVIEDYLFERGRRAGSLLKSDRYRESKAQEGGDGLSAKYVARLASNAIKRAGVPESGHALRHTCAVDMLDNGADIRDVQTVLGHRSIATTQIYVGLAQVHELRPFMGHHPRKEEDGGAA